MECKNGISTKSAAKQKKNGKKKKEEYVQLINEECTRVNMCKVQQGFSVFILN